MGGSGRRLEELSDQDASMTPVKARWTEEKVEWKHPHLPCNLRKFSP